MRKALLPLLLLCLVCNSELSAQKKKAKKTKPYEPIPGLVYRNNGGGYMTKEGRILSDGYVLGGKPFSDGFAVVEMFFSEAHYIDTNGVMLVSPSGNNNFPQPEPFSDGLAAYRDGYIDQSGTKVISGSGKKSPFLGGVAAMERDGQWQIINKKGEKLALIEHNEVIRRVLHPTPDLFVAVLEGSSSANYDAKGKQLSYTECKLTSGVFDMTTFQGGSAKVWVSGTGLMLVDSSFKQLTPDYEYISLQEDSYNLFSTNKGKHFLRNGKQLTEAEYLKHKEAPAKVLALAAGKEVKSKGEGIYEIKNADASSFLVDSTGRELGVYIGNPNAADRHISHVGDFHNGYAWFGTSNVKLVLDSEIEQFMREAEQERREEQAQQNKKKQDAAMADEMMNGKICKRCNGRGKIDTSAQIQHNNDFGRTVKTTTSKVATTGSCPDCSGQGRIRK